MIEKVCEKCGNVFFLKKKTGSTKCGKCRRNEAQKKYYQKLKDGKNEIKNKTVDIDNSLGVLLQNMNNLFINFNTEYNKSYNSVHTKDLETSDLLHEIELREMSDKELVKKTEKLRDVRIERRKAKDRVEELKTIRSFIDKYNQKFIVKDLAIAIKQYQEYTENIKKRTYTHRVSEETENIID